MKQLKMYGMVFVLSLLLTACGSDGGGGGVLQGVFLDSEVDGLTFICGSQSGTTDANGTFSYEQGGSCTFKVGDIVLGTANAQAVMTPISLVPGSVDETNPTVTNIVRFLMTIDDDNDPTNGIQITASVDTAAIGQSLDFTLIDFDTDSDLLDAIALLTAVTTWGPSTLVSEQAAQTQLNNTLMTTIAGIYNGTYSGDDSGTWTIVVNTNGTATGSGCSTTQQAEFNITGTEGWKKNKYLGRTLSRGAWVEIFLTLYFLAGIVLAFILHDYGLLPFHVMLFTGFGLVFYFSVKHSRVA